MKSLRGWFNIFFVIALAALLAGCHSTGSKKQLATIRLFVEAGRGGSSAGRVLVTRQRIPMSIEREAFLDEGDLSDARLIEDADGTFSIELVFDDHGAMVLDMTSVANRGRHIIIHANFPPPGTKEDTGTGPMPTSESEPSGKPRKGGWISAVMINGRLSNGTVRFTPDTSHEEAERIVKGLKNVIKMKSSF